MKKLVSVITLLFVGIGVLTARPLSDIDQMEGLSYAYVESENITYISTPYFRLFEWDDSYWARIFVYFTGKVLPNKDLCIVLRVDGFDESNRVKELIIQYDGKRLCKEDKRYFGWGLFRMTSTEIQALVKADTVVGTIEYRRGGMLSNSATEYFNLFYEAVVLNRWQGILEEQERQEAPQKEEIRKKISAKRKEDSLFVQGVLQRLNKFDSTVSISSVCVAIKSCEKYEWQMPQKLIAYKLQYEEDAANRLLKEARDEKFKAGLRTAGWTTVYSVAIVGIVIFILLLSEAAETS